MRPLPLDLTGGAGLTALAPDGSTMLVRRGLGDFEVVRRDDGHVVVHLPNAVEDQSRCGLVFSEIGYVGNGRFVASPFQASGRNRCGPASVELWNTTSGDTKQIDVPPGACPGALESVGLSLNDRILVLGCSSQNPFTVSRARCQGTWPASTSRPRDPGSYRSIRSHSALTP